ncbi:MAG: SBBP repeat-containing protein [Candidatus Aminicenantes bacterium]|nr:SBBP repeat-containing protein [Candidatus Aminicenantes bacterium]
MAKIHKPLNILFWPVLLVGLLALSGAEIPRGNQTIGRVTWNAGPKGPAPAESPNEAKVKQNLTYGNIPLYFVPNRGQVNEAARFYARASRYTLWLTAQGLVFDRSVSKENPADWMRPWEREESIGLGAGMPGRKPGVVETDAEGRGTEIRRGERLGADNPRREGNRGERIREVHRLVFLGANPEPKIEGEGGTRHTANYFIGSDPAKWRTNIAASRAAVYKEVYQNIDLKVYGVEKQIEYDWLVKPGGDPEAIDFAYQDVLGTEIDARGDLIIRSELGEFRHRKPDAYQERPDGSREAVEALFRRIGPDRYGFSIAHYDHTRPLVIDPVVIIYSTLVGGSGDENCFGVAVDDSGCAYAIGRTTSLDFPTVSSFQSSGSGSYDVFAFKLAPSGQALLYSTYLGGKDADEGWALAVDSSGCAYLTGLTFGSDFPIINAFQATYNGGLADVFVTKLAPDGQSLVYSTYLGGSYFDTGWAIAVDMSGCAHIGGATSSDDFPVVNAYQANYGGSQDAFITKLAPDGRTALFSTFLGGQGGERVLGIVVDGYGYVYLTGDTTSTNFPTRNPFQGFLRGWADAFAAKIGPQGNSLEFSTYLGGEGTDLCFGIAIDSTGCSYITGVTYSEDFPTRDPIMVDPLDFHSDAFVSKLSADGHSLLYSTYLGGSHDDQAMDIALDGDSCIYVVGFTESPDFPCINSPMFFRGESDAFVAKIVPSGQSLVFSTYLGGKNLEGAYDLALDSLGSAYIVGHTDSVDFPLVNSFQPYVGFGDAFVTKLDMAYTVTALVSGAGGAVSPATQTVLEGETATINIYPETRYTISSITDNGGSVDVANPYVINNVREDHDVVVTFARVYTVTASVSGFGGSVNPTTQTIIGGETATINIYPDLGYHIGSIRDNGVSVAIASPYVINDVQEDHSVVVTFANAPPTVKIVNPTNGAKVYGVVTVKAEASDDLRVLNVAFFIDEQLIGEDAFAESTNIYTQAWDTRGYSAGIHRIKAVAFDEAGLTAEHEISVVVENVALTLQAQRLTERAWILRKPFVRITIGIQNLGQVVVAKYVIYRKNGTGDFKSVKEVTGSEASGQSYVWDDKAINNDQKYTYRVVALSSGGLVLGISNELTL